MNLAVLHVRAQKLAQDALVGVTDKVGKPIYEHCQRVASKFPMSAERIVAILHEIVEDSDVTLADLSVEHEFPEEIVRAVEAITHVKGEDYPDYIVRVSRNKIATAVKLADLRDNMDITRLPKLVDSDYRRLLKYHTAYLFLRKEWEYAYKTK